MINLYLVNFNVNFNNHNLQFDKYFNLNWQKYNFNQSKS